MKRTQGFTLLEVVVVIVILGVLTATGLPRFVNFRADAKIASINGLAASMRSGAALVQAKWMVVGNSADTTVDMADGTTVRVGTGSGPDAGLPVSAGNGIDRAINLSTAHYICGGNPVRVCTLVGGSAACAATYDHRNGAVNTITTGC